MKGMHSVLLALLLAMAPVATAATSPAPGSRLDPRLAAALAPGSEPVPVWVEFADKGEAGPADLAQRLADAERRLTPEARRRRERAGVQPLVDWLDLPVEERYVHELTARGFAPYGTSRWFNRVAVRASGDALASLAALPFVRRVAPVELARVRERETALDARRAPGAWSASLRGTESAALVNYGRTLGQLSRLNVPAMHDSGFIGTGVGVCVLDEGFNFYRKHEALRTVLVGGGRTRDFIRGVNSVQDTVEAPGIFEHGSWVLSALAGNAPGRYVGPGYGAHFALGRTEYSGSETQIEMVWWAMGAEWADSLGSDIISSSLGYNLFDDPDPDLTYAMLDGHTSVITRAAEIAAAKGILVVVSAGNDGARASVGYKVGAPADAHGDSVLAIGAVDSLGFRPAFSSKGPTVDGRIKPDLAAQGVDVIVATADGNPNSYIRLNGTSFSAPLVAGMAACLMQARPSWPAVWIAQALKRTASHAATPDTLTGWGLPDGLAALRYTPDTLGVPDLHGPLSFTNAGANPLHTGSPAVFRLALGVEFGASRYRLRVFDAGGRWVRDLAQGNLTPGSTLSIRWNGDDASGRSLAPGLYFLDLESAGQHKTDRVVVLR